MEQPRVAGEGQQTVRGLEGSTGRECETTCKVWFAAVLLMISL